MTDQSPGPLPAQSFEYSQIYEPNGPWDTSRYLHHTPHMLPSHRSYPEPESPAFWRPNESSGSGSYPQAHFPMSPSPVSAATKDNVDHMNALQSMGGHGWAPRQPPMRSMSLANPDDLPPQYQAQYYNNSPIDFGRRMTTPSENQTPTLSSNTNSTGSVSDHQPVPSMISYDAHGVPIQSMHLSYPPPWSSIPPSRSPQIATSGSEGFSQGWYTNSPGLALVTEEDPTSHFGHTPHPDYSIFKAEPG